MHSARKCEKKLRHLLKGASKKKCGRLGWRRAANISEAIKHGNCPKPIQTNKPHRTQRESKRKMQPENESSTATYPSPQKTRLYLVVKKSSCWLNASIIRLLATLLYIFTILMLK